MKRTGYIISCILAALCVGSVSADYLYWQAVKAPSQYTISFWANVTDPNAIYVKGPQMADYEQVNIEEGGTMIGWRMVNLSLPELNTQSQGTWYVKVTFDAQPDSISSFDIINGINDSEFLPVPNILYPTEGAADVIAEHCTFQWNPNGADAGADIFVLSTGGDHFSYGESSFYGPIQMSDTSWKPGWLEQGSAYFKIGYWVFMWNKRTPITHVSGTVINWESDTPRPTWLSGDRVEYEVTKTLDLNDDDLIDLSDMSIMMGHWLESK